jgi:hypothetical protein
MFLKTKTSCDSPVLSTVLMTILLLTACCPEPGLAQVEIRYIDDELGDLITGELPVYSPGNGWIQGATCTGCGFHPDVQEAFNHTWHDTTHHTTDPTRSVQFNFTGTSLQVFCILPNPTDPILTSTYNLTFTLDNVALTQTFVHESDLSTDFQFNASVFYMDNLSQSTHTFTMLAASTVVNSTIQFDYAAYTVDLQSGSIPNSPSPSLNFPSPSVSVTSTSTPAAAERPSVATIAGATAGGICFLLLAIALSMFYCYRHKHRIRQRIFMSSLRSGDFDTNVDRVEPFTSTPVSHHLNSHNMRENNPQASPPPYSTHGEFERSNYSHFRTTVPAEVEYPRDGRFKTGSIFLSSNSTRSSR